MTFTDAEEIRRRHAQGESYRQLADYYGVSHTHIARIVKGQAHADARRCERGFDCVAKARDRVFKGNNGLCEACLAAIDLHNRRHLAARRRAYAGE